MLPNGVSDHNPLKISFGERTQSKEPMFRFEKWRLEVEEFVELVKKNWDTECPFLTQLMCGTLRSKP
jgi:hypothetical protein